LPQKNIALAITSLYYLNFMAKALCLGPLCSRPCWDYGLNSAFRAILTCNSCPELQFAGIGVLRGNVFLPTGQMIIDRFIKSLTIFTLLSNLSFCKVLLFGPPSNSPPFHPPKQPPHPHQQTPSMFKPLGLAAFSSRLHCHPEFGARVTDWQYGKCSAGDSR
jgi:hypothetical protein